GCIEGTQQAIHLNLSYKSKYNKGDAVNVFETPFGNIFLCVDVDIYKPEVLRTAAAKNAQIVVSSQFILDCDYDFNKIYFGAYNAALSNGFFVINTNNNTSSVIGPVLSDENDGFAVAPMRRLPITATLNTDYLQKFKFADSIFESINRQICSKYSNKLWR
ncbi:MAG TPA: hypothetical protein DCP97_00515, partial [Ruminococcaceae bacterium]|nr:hypothetical protein [Oscillospiraceae bacterium]